MWYTITAGDSLSKLAARFLGDMMAYMEIFKQNTDVLSSPDLVKIGQTIWIPVGGKPNPKLVKVNKEFTTVTPEVISTGETTFTPASQSASSQAPQSAVTEFLKSPNFNQYMIYGGVALGVLALFMMMRKN